MSASELMPNLQLAPLSKIQFHEHPEQNRTKKLVGRIEKDMMLRNPPIVADMDNSNYLLLDGANRVGVFQELEFSHIPVQVVDYGDSNIQLKGWHHLLVNGRSLNLHSSYSAIDGTKLIQVKQERLTHFLELRRVYAILVDENTNCWGLFPESGEGAIEIHDRIRVLEMVVGSYEGQSKLERVKLADFSQLPDVILSVEYQLCLVPIFTKSELMLLAQENKLIPTGLSRHLIPGRALGINLDLKFLRELSNDEEKKSHFDNYIKQLEMEGKIRFYEESVFILNE